MKIVVAGTDTGVGKTVVSTILTEALGGFYWKPIQCGLPTDSDWVDKHLFLSHRCYPGICLKTPCSPHLAARLEGMSIRRKDLILPKCDSSPLIIEGVGGVLTPINEEETWIDVAAEWGASWVLVHRHYLGGLNHFFLTIEAMYRRNLPLAGIVFNGKGDLATEEMLVRKAKSRVLMRLPWQKRLTPNNVQKIAKEMRQVL